MKTVCNYYSWSLEVQTTLTIIVFICNIKSFQSFLNISGIGECFLLLSKPSQLHVCFMLIDTKSKSNECYYKL